jgi:tRNA A37 N6-isopentenylltransferase MiaA
MSETEEKLAIAQAEIRELKAQLTIDKLVAAGDTVAATQWLQAKARRQARALEVLNRRVVNQRFQLRLLNDLGRGLTKEEWLAAKAEVTNEQVAEKLEFASA